MCVKAEQRTARLVALEVLFLKTILKEPNVDNATILNMRVIKDECV